MERASFRIRFKQYRKFFIVFILLFVAVEYLFQKTDDVQEYTYFFTKPGAEIWNEDPELFWVSREYPQWMKRIEKLPADKLVYCFGGSIVRGDFADTSFCKEMVSCLPEGYQVVNFGTSGYTSHQSLVLFQRAVEKKAPKIAIVCHGWNDNENGPATDLEMTERNQRTSTHILFWLSKSKIVQKLRRAIRKLPGRDPYRMADSGNWKTRVSAREYRRNMIDFAKIAGEKGIDLVFLSQGIPDPETRASLQHYFSRLKAIADAGENVYYFDLGGKLDQLIIDLYGHPILDHTGAEAKHLYLDLCHLNDFGHGKAAEMLCDFLNEEGLTQ